MSDDNVLPFPDRSAPDPDVSDDLNEAELVAALAAGMVSAVAGSRTPLEAEVHLSGMLGSVEFGIEGGNREIARVQYQLVTGLAGVLVDLGSPTALAALRLLAGLALDPAAGVAAQAADDLAGTGVVPPAWVGRLGNHTLLRAWSQSDVFGSQVGLGMLFSDRGRDHALMVLIDHGLGGGIKDLIVAEGRVARSLRDETVAQCAGNPLAVFDDLDATDAAVTLRQALQQPPCPEQDDQVEDVEQFLPLVRARARALARAAGLADDALLLEPVPGDDDVADDEVLRVKVSIEGARPPIWRRLELPASLPLSLVHEVLQIAFDWNGGHLSQFEEVLPGRAPGRRFQAAAMRRVSLGELLHAKGDRLVYRYDFGDDWQHLMVVENRFPAVDGVAYPRCTGGRRAAPPDDCGGIWGYAELLAAIDDPEHPEHEDTVEWLGQDFDPARFDRGKVEARLRRHD